MLALGNIYEPADPEDTIHARPLDREYSVVVESLNPQARSSGLGDLNPGSIYEIVI